MIGSCRSSLVFGFASACVLAAALAAGPAVAEERSGWAFSAGAFDVDNRREIFEAGIEYRLRPFALDLGDRAALRPAFGLTGHEDGGIWAYGGLRLDWWPARRVVLTPSLSVALFDEGDGKDLQGSVQFRSGLELAFRLRGGSRLGVVFYHLSNAGLEEPNPGSNSLALVWSLGR